MNKLLFLLLIPIFVESAALLPPFPKFAAYDSNGNPCTGCKLYTYVGGSVNTNKTSWTDSNGNVANTNPVVLDASGRADVWLTPIDPYKLILKSSSGSTIWSVDNVSVSGSSNVSLALSNLSDVSISSLVGGDVLTYDSTLTKWTNFHGYTTVHIKGDNFFIHNSNDSNPGTSTNYARLSFGGVGINNWLIPDVTGTPGTYSQSFVGDTKAQTLTNKTFEDASTKFISTSTGKKITFSLSNIASTDKTITFPNATTTLVGASDKGVVNGVASLDGSGKVPTSQLTLGYEKNSVTTGLHGTDSPLLVVKKFNRIVTIGGSGSDVDLPSCVDGDFTVVNNFNTGGGITIYAASGGVINAAAASVSLADNAGNMFICTGSNNWDRVTL